MKEYITFINKSQKQGLNIVHILPIAHRAILPGTQYPLAIKAEAES
jgi:hypothetical protein